MDDQYKIISEGLRDMQEHFKREVSLTDPDKKPYVKPLGRYSKEDLKRIRRITGLSLGMFAACMSVPKQTLEGWEKGNKGLPEPVIRLYQIIEQEPAIFKRTFL